MPYVEQLAMSIELSEDPSIFSHICKAKPLQTIQNCVNWGENYEASSLNALEELFINIPSDCLRIIQQYVSHFPKKQMNIHSEYNVSRPLHIAAKQGRIDIVEYLLSIELNINSINIYGETPLYLAAEAGHTEMVKFLLSKGALDTTDEVAQFFQNPLYPFIAACKEGHLDTVIALSKSNICQSKYRIHIDGHTPFEFPSALRYAISNGHIRVVRYLLQHGHIPNDWTRDGTVFIAATEYGSVKQMKLLIESKLVDRAYINFTSSTGVSPLISAAFHNNIPLVRYLLTCNVNMLITNMNCMTAYGWACSHGNITMMKLFEEAGGHDLKFRKWNGLFSAVTNNKIHAVNHIMTQGADINMKLVDKGDYLLHYANTPDMISLLIKYGAKVNVRNYMNESPLYLYVKCGNILCVKEILKYKPCMSYESNDTGLTAAMLCISRASEEIYSNIFDILLEKINTNLRTNTVQYGRLNITEYSLLSKQYDISIVLLNKTKYINAICEMNGFTLLHFACFVSAPIGILEYIIEKGANINIKCNKGRTPLYYLLSTNNLEGVELLLQHGANPNMYMNGIPLLQYSILHYYSHPFLYRIIALFMEKGADIHAVNKNTHMTSLMASAETGNIVLLQYCLLEGANINAQQKDGTTALMIAASKGHILCVEKLIQHKADLYLKNNDGQTALLFATQNEHQLIINLLALHMKILG